jgi:predicted thioesterase
MVLQVYATPFKVTQHLFYSLNLLNKFLKKSHVWVVYPLKFN